MELSSGLTIQENELIFSFVHSSGPGGQNVNKVVTSAQLRFDVRNSPSLTEEMKKRLTSLAGSRMTNDGTLLIVAKRYRTREQNRVDALFRLVVLLEKAAIQPKTRLATRPSMTSRINRIATKKKRGAVKKLRKPSGEE